VLELQNETRMHKREFKMRSTYITKKRRRLMQVEWKWCNRLSWDNFRHKLYMARTFGSRHHSPPYSILCASLWGLHPNVTFPILPNGSPKIEILVVPRFWTFILTHSQFPEGFKNESMYKTTEGGGIEGRSLAHNTLRGKGAC